MCDSGWSMVQTAGDAVDTPDSMHSLRIKSFCAVISCCHRLSSVTEGMRAMAATLAAMRAEMVRISRMMVSITDGGGLWITRI